jgi:plastocyanin
MRRPALVLAICACSFAACGEDGDGGSKGRTVTVGAEQGVRLVANEYSFDPNHFVVTGSPSQLEITLDNRGSLAHNVKVLSGERDLGGSPTFPGGEVRSGKVSLRPGSYRLVCTVGDHERLGMVGTLEVRK